MGLTGDPRVYISDDTMGTVLRREDGTCVAFTGAELATLKEHFTRDLEMKLVELQAEVCYMQRDASDNSPSWAETQWGL